MVQVTEQGWPNPETAHAALGNSKAQILTGSGGGTSL